MNNGKKPAGRRRPGVVIGGIVRRRQPNRLDGRRAAAKSAPVTLDGKSSAPASSKMPMIGRAKNPNETAKSAPLTAKKFGKVRPAKTDAAAVKTTKTEMPADELKQIDGLKRSGQATRREQRRAQQLSKRLARNAARAQKLAARHARRWLFKRWDNLLKVRREVAGWLVLVLVLIAGVAAQNLVYARGLTSTGAAAGGSLVEGIVGQISSVNPLFAQTDNEKALSNLIYAPLFNYQNGKLSGALATRWQISNDGKTYLILLRSGVKFSDGTPLTASDVVWTIDQIQNSATGSPLADTFKNVKAEVATGNEVKFTLATPFAPFLNNLTFGILPGNELKDMSAGDLRADLSSKPAVGAGAFVWRNQQTDGSDSQIFLTPNQHYYGGAAKLNILEIRTFSSSGALAKALKTGAITAAAGLNSNDASGFANDKTVKLSQLPLDDGVFALFNCANLDQNLRAALRLGVDRTTVIQAATIGTLAKPTALNSPIALGLDAKIDALTQPKSSQVAAADALNKLGWTLNQKTGKREKSGQTLTLNVVTASGTDYAAAAQNLVSQWQSLGIDARLTLADPATIQQNYLIGRAYDVLVYQLHLGADPDEFAYWASSQAAPTGLNFSNYKSSLSDIALSGGRTRLDPALRASKYLTFAKQWLNDAPAIALYRPNYYDAIATSARAALPANLVSPADRFYDAPNWTVKSARYFATP
ncbi:MAG: ABC transporter substrate-binding protein [Candidatus Nomurabacteria bacterium]|jgi:peptide/nickel transport system substrate-binding protein|nr:ABC transporter substrate-binding protein [Candidatus Nomurabacteria bacterium]